MAGPARTRRLSRRIQKIVASVIECEIEDRRLGFATITDCHVTGDLHDATVSCTVRGRTLDEESDYESAAATLEKTKGQPCSLVGHGTGVHYTPTLAFEADTVPKISAHFEGLLDKTRACDAKLAKQARDTEPVGDVNPYHNEE